MTWPGYGRRPDVPSVGKALQTGSSSPDSLPGGSAPPGYGYAPPYGYGTSAAAYPYPMLRPSRHPKATTSALMFTQAGLVVYSTVHAQIFLAWIGVRGSEGTDSGNTLATEFGILGVLQLISAVVLIVGGVRLRSGGLRAVGVVANVCQLLLGAYWLVRIPALEEFSEGAGLLYPAAILLAVLPAIALSRLFRPAAPQQSRGASLDALDKPTKGARPSQASTAATLMFIQAGCVAAVAAVWLLYLAVGDTAALTPVRSLTMIAISLVQLASAGALVLGGRQLQNGANCWVAILANLVQLALVGYWIADFEIWSKGPYSEGGAYLVALVFAVAPTVALALAANADVRRYVHASPRDDTGLA